MDWTSNKGKGKAKATTQLPSEIPGDPEIKSLARKLIESSSGLAKDLTAPSSREAISGLSSLGSEKARPSGSISTATGESSLFKGSSSDTGSRYQSNLNEPFREIGNDGTHSEEMMQFMEHRSTFESLQVASSNERSSIWASEFNEHKPLLDPQSHVEFNNYQREDYNDGSEVRALLSDPDFVTISDVYDVEDMSIDTTAELFSQDFSEIEQQAVKKIRADLPVPPVHNHISETNPLNLIPDFGDRQASLSPYDDPIASQISISQWSDVLNRYTDDVWGDLLPVVEKIKQQLEDAKTGASSMDGKAIERLRMVLDHINLDLRLDNLGFHNHGASQSQTLSHTQGFSQTAADARTAGIVKVPTISEYLSESHGEQLRETPHEHEATKNPHERETEQSHTSRDSDSSESSLPEFHCPWISCHERFHNMTDLRRHSASHKLYHCPHTSCEETLLTKNDWIKHIKMAHHDLLDNYDFALDVINEEKTK
jgi:hypothetical protein